MNGHFTTQDQQNNKDRRSADLPAPKKVKPGFRKTRSRRPNAWSGRCHNSAFMETTYKVNPFKLLLKSVEHE